MSELHILTTISFAKNFLTSVFFLKVTSVALVSAYSLAWHCVNTVARAVVRHLLH